MAILYKEGSKGTVVKQIQRVVGCYPDGIWGKLTTEAVRTFQRDNGLTPDGVVGPATLAKLMLSVKWTGTTQTTDAQGQIGNVVLRKSKRRIDYIAVHCTATPEGQDQTVAQIKAGHLKRGFSDVGYHYIIYRDGTVHEGRNVDISGAHVSGYNAHSIGVVYVGGLENRPGVPYAQLKAKDTRTEAQKAALLALLMDLRRLYPDAVIQGHRDFSPDLNHNGIIEPKEWIKACPSFDAKREYSMI